MAAVPRRPARLGLWSPSTLLVLLLTALASSNAVLRKARSADDVPSPEEAQRTADSWDEPFAPSLMLDTPLKNQTKHVGDRVVFDCEITGKPTPRYKWFKDDEELVGDDSPSSSKRYKIQDQDWGSRLRIMKIIEEDKGTYRCRAENAGGSKETVAGLKLKAGLPTTSAPTLAPRVTVTTPEEERRHVIHPMVHSDDDDVEPYCQLYKGTACRMLGGELIYVTSRRSQHLADNRVIRAITDLAAYLPDKENSQCWQKVHEATCRYQMPLCATENQRSHGRRLCQADCEALVTVCRPEFKGQSKAWQLLPNCREASTHADCISINLSPKITTTAGLKDSHVEAAASVDDDLTHMLKIVIPCSVGVVAVIAIVGGVCACKRRRSRLPSGKGPASTAAAVERKKMQDMSLVSAAASGTSSGEKVAVAGAGTVTAFVKDVPVSNVHMMQELGEGEFGKVFVGQVFGMFGANTSSVVLVKTLRDRAPPPLAIAFRKEIEDMIEVRHQHVSLLLGVSMKGSPQCALYEYLPAGDLHQVLSRAASPDGAMIGGGGGGQPGAPAAAAAPLQLREQMYVVTQVASALEYLASIGRVHGDVAARNVLVGHGLITKLSNVSITFGLYSADYCQLHGRPAPIRWQPPESIAYGRRSLESDVYSFGVLVWEVFASSSDGAERPYAGCSNQEVMALVRARQLLPCPAACPPRIYSLMMECWHEAAAKRPAARELHQKLRAWYLDGGGSTMAGPLQPAVGQTSAIVPPQNLSHLQQQPVVDWLAGTAIPGSSGSSSVAPSLQSYSSAASASAAGGGGGNPSNSTNLTDVRSGSSSSAAVAADSLAGGGGGYCRPAPYGNASTAASMLRGGQGAAAAGIMSPGGYSDAAGGYGDSASSCASRPLMPTAFSTPNKKFVDPPLLSGDY